MVNAESLAGHWNQVRGKLKEKWGKLTDDDVRAFNGNVDQLVGRIQQKTGETREVVERFLGEVADEGSSVMETAREKVQETADQVADSMRQGYDGLRQGYAEAERVVQERPGQSIALAFGVGLLVGVGAALLLRERSRPTMMEQSRGAAEQFRQHMRDMIASMMPDSLKSGRG